MMGNSKVFYSQKYSLSNLTILFAKEICLYYSIAGHIKCQTRLSLLYKKRVTNDVAFVSVSEA